MIFYVRITWDDLDNYGLVEADDHDKAEDLIIEEFPDEYILDIREVDEEMLWYYGDNWLIR
jgi:hypothetical protein